MVSPSFSVPLAFSLRRSAVSTAYSSNGFGFHSRPSVVTDLPSPATLTLLALSGSLTRLTGTRIFTHSLHSGPGQNLDDPRQKLDHARLSMGELDENSRRGGVGSMGVGVKTSWCFEHRPGTCLPLVVQSVSSRLRLRRQAPNPR